MYQRRHPPSEADQGIRLVSSYPLSSQRYRERERAAHSEPDSVQWRRRRSPPGRTLWAHVLHSMRRAHLKHQQMILTTAVTASSQPLYPGYPSDSV